MLCGLRQYGTCGVPATLLFSGGAQCVVQVKEQTLERAKKRNRYAKLRLDPDNPSRAGLRVFRVPPRHFVKLHAGTWHAGPLWTHDASRTFVNLELADTNVTDHSSVDLVPPDAEPIPILPPAD